MSAIVSRSGVPVAWVLPDEAQVDNFATMAAAHILDQKGEANPDDRASEDLGRPVQTEVDAAEAREDGRDARRDAHLPTEADRQEGGDREGARRVAAREGRIELGGALVAREGADVREGVARSRAAHEILDRLGGEDRDPEDEEHVEGGLAQAFQPERYRDEEDHVDAGQDREEDEDSIEDRIRPCEIQGPENRLVEPAGGEGDEGVHAPPMPMLPIKGREGRNLLAAASIALRLGPRAGDLSSTPRPLRTAALVARGDAVRGDRRRAPHAPDRLAERGRSDQEPEGGRPPRRASARIRIDPRHSETREGGGPVPDEADAAPRFLSPPSRSLGGRFARILRSPAGGGARRPALASSRGPGDRPFDPPASRRPCRLPGRRVHDPDRTEGRPFRLRRLRPGAAAFRGAPAARPRHVPGVPCAPRRPCESAVPPRAAVRGVPAAGSL